MISKIRAAQQKEEGFTLIELLVVVIIIGILAAIAIPVFLNQREKAYKKAAQSDARNAAIQVESYFADNNAYPEAVGGTLTWTSPSGTVGSETVTVSDQVTLTYIHDTTNSYCIRAAHAQLAAADTVYYDSNAGGITDTPC